jgi:hypothetical protein
MTARRHLAVALACTTVALAIFTVSHFHGLSDPQTHHSRLDGLLFAQGQSGFLIALPLSILFAPGGAGWVWGLAGQARPYLRGDIRFARAPPLRSSSPIEAC